jgi:signal-transduction protein with cAMP-binding, CBS, and nucleotidyltransferase domain
VSVSVGSAVRVPSVFDGVPAEEVADILGRLEMRRFPTGSVVVAEGDYPRQIYVTESGSADVFVAGSGDFADGRRYCEAGEAALEAALPRIASLLPWVGA